MIYNEVNEFHYYSECVSQLTNQENIELISMLNEEDRHLSIIKELEQKLLKIVVWDCNKELKKEIFLSVYRSWGSSPHFAEEEWDEDNLPPSVINTGGMLKYQIETFYEYVLSYTGETYFAGMTAPPVEPDCFCDRLHQWIMIMVKEYCYEMCTTEYGMDDIEADKLSQSQELNDILNGLCSNILDDIIITYGNYRYLEIGIEALLMI